jgi:hypothetical protein
MNPGSMFAGLGEAMQAPAGSSFTVSAAFGFFNILVGLMLVAAFLFFFGGLAGYLSRLGLEGRIDGLRYMYRGVVILFVLIVLLGIVNFLQQRPTVVYMIIAIALVVFVIWGVMQSFQGGEEEDHK